MKKYVSWHFTMKGQDFQTVLKPILDRIGVGEDDWLVHGFMNRKAVEDAGYPTEVIDYLYKRFGHRQISFYGVDGVERLAMATYMGFMEGTAYIIGQDREGVREEHTIMNEQDVIVDTTYGIPMDTDEGK